tara:strand:- start:2753 stop:3211 length:459 start_codon:yes stop_codon:yes gene_type:complete
MTWWMVAGAVVSAYGAMQAGKARAAEARARQAQLEEQKKDAEVVAMQEHNIRMANLDALLGLNKSLAGVMGRDSGSDRSLNAIRESAKVEAVTDDSRARYQYISEQSQRSMGIQIAGMQAKNAKRAGQYKAMSSLLTAGHEYSQITPGTGTG